MKQFCESFKIKSCEIIVACLNVHIIKNKLNLKISKGDNDCYYSCLFELSSLIQNYTLIFLFYFPGVLVTLTVA